MFIADKNILSFDTRYSRVASFSRSAVYQAPDFGYPLLSVLSESECRHPFSISSPDNPEFFDCLTVRNGVIRLGDVRINKDNAVFFDSRCHLPEVFVLNEDNLMTYLRAFFPFSVTGIPYDRFYRVEPVRRYLHADDLLNQIQGLGSGLTPEGDDFILGYNTAAAVTGQVRKKWISRDMNFYSLNLDFLFSGCFFPQFLHALIDDLSGNEAVSGNRIGEVITMVSSFGSTTGYSICDGFFFGLLEFRTRSSADSP